jgi:hypothetical protein
MNRLIRVFLLLFFICLLPAGVLAGEDKTTINIAYTHNKLSLPILGSPIAMQLFPGVMIGKEFKYKEKKHIDRMGAVVMKVSLHPGSPYGSVFSLGTEIGPRLGLDNGIYFDGLAGIHYTHIFSNLATFKLTETSVKQKRDWGRPNITLNFGFTMGYDFSKQLDTPMKLFLRKDIEVTYGPSLHFGLMNLLPASTLMVGSQFSL